MDELKNFIKANPKRRRPMLEEIKGETFKEYYKTLKDDLYSNLALAGHDKASMSPSFVQVTEITLLVMAKGLWAGEVRLKQMEESRESFAAVYSKSGYQPNKSDLDDSKPPQDTGESK